MLFHQPLENSTNLRYRLPYFCYIHQEEENYQRIIKENEAYKKAEALKIIQDNAKAVAKELNVRDDRFDKLFKLSDTSKFTKEDGSVDKEAIKTEFEKQLKDLPEFTQKKQIVISAGSNSHVKPHEITDAEEYRKQKYGKSKYFRGQEIKKYGIWKFKC